ncbi:Hypothetical protein A7982_09204 [Minicystis rosea]|nr:Hypothetical protein A7982_09204 [Minicystis rosea]
MPPAPPPVGAIPAYPDPPASSARVEPGAAFAALRDRLVDQFLADDPSLGRGAGLHQYDGKVGAYSAQAIKARIERLEQARADLAAVDEAALSPDDRLDRALLRSRVDLALFQLVELEEWRRRPKFYDELFSVDAYLERDYAPVAERAAHLLAHEEAALAEIPNIRKNLVSPLSRPVVETAVKSFKGYATYLRTDLTKMLKGVGTPAFQEKLQKTNEALAAAAQDLADHLAKVELPKSDASHVLGPERYKKLLRVQEGLEVSLADFKKMGEENLAENKKAYEALLKKKAAVTRTKAKELFGDATRLTDASRRFLIDKHIVTVPTDEKAVVKESPPFMRWNSAFLDAPGPFEAKPLDAFYYITQPDPSWPKKEQLEYLPTRGVLLSTTVHEVYPGHFLQGLWVKRAPTRVQKLFSSYSFVEGWAHYGEQMMIEEGFGAADPESRLGQLSDALLRNCRVVVSLGIHAEGMTIEQAQKRFMDDCKQDKATAREQAARGAFDPGYFAYTLGKIQILALREEAKKKLGAKFSLQRFHDALLAHGSPPVPLIRERVLSDLAR